MLVWHPMITTLVKLIRDPKLYQYIMVGCGSAVVDFGVFFWLRSQVDLHYLILATISFVFATLTNYILCNTFVFKNHQRFDPKARFALTYLVSAVGLAIHHTCLFLCVEWLLLPMLVSKIVAVGIAFLWNFSSRRYFVFKAA